MTRGRKVFFVFLALLIIVASFILMTCKTEEKVTSDKKSDEVHEEVITIHDAIPGRPELDIKVIKRYDKDGKLIVFDSTYSAYYSDLILDTVSIDSLIVQFKPFYRDFYLPLIATRMDQLLFNDSILYPDFFHDDFFTRRYSLNVAYFNDLALQMDSIKNEFYKKNSNFKN